jgi:hypothetical protein
MAVAIIDTDLVYTCVEAAAAIERATGEAIAVASVQKYLKNYGTEKTPQLKGIQIGREWLIPVEELQRFCDDRRPPGRRAGT